VYVSTLFQQIMGYTIPTTTLNNYLSYIASDDMTRLAVYKSILSLPGANTSAQTTAGTEIQFINSQTVTGSLSVHTNQGWSANSITLVAEAVPAVTPPVDTLTIGGITPTLVTAGQTVNVFGTGYTANTKVYLGSVLVSQTYVSVNEIYFVVPTTVSSYATTVSLYEPSTNEWATFNYIYVSQDTPFSSETYVIETLFDDVDLNQSLTTISNPITGDIGNQGPRGRYLSQPIYSVTISGLGDLTASTTPPSLGGYQPTNDNSIVSAEFTTLSLNGVTQTDPNSISLGILNHVDLAPVTA
jgi:hypothetical protein